MKYRSALVREKYHLKFPTEFQSSIDDTSVSVVIPVSGSEYCGRLVNCLESIKEQQHLENVAVEVCVFCLSKKQDDVSEIGILCDQYGGMFCHEVLDYDHYPLALARNVGAHCTTGKQIIFIDADIILDPEAIAYSLVDSADFSTIWTLYTDKGMQSDDYNHEDFRANVALSIKSGARVCTVGYGGFLRVQRCAFQHIRGYDQLYDVGWGAEDNDIVDRLIEAGYSYTNVSKVFGIISVHQWHETAAHDRTVGTHKNRERYANTTTVVRNTSEWGIIPKCATQKSEFSQETVGVKMLQEKPKILLVSDVRGWAFDQNMQDLAEYLSDRFDFEHGYVAEWCLGNPGAPDMGKFDAVYCLYHQWGIDRILPWGKVLGALRAQWIFPERKAAPGDVEFEVVNRYEAYQVVTQLSYEQFKSQCPHVVYLTNPVNMRRFPKPARERSEIVVSWNGNAGHTNCIHEDVKGFRSIVKPACREAGLRLNFAEYNTCRRDPSDMPDFYQQSNVAVCASLYEGASNSVMEAMASGLAVIATDVGNHREMVESQLAEYGDTGILLVDRNVASFVAALKKLKEDLPRVSEMGRLNRLEIERAWSWSVWADRYADFLRTTRRG